MFMYMYMQVVVVELNDGMGMVIFTRMKLTHE